ncbi:putative oxidoreductase [Prochlorococcus sp. MIT 0601]|nr:putative oxidoreductase [Prochlorococcus sp. MIT 0601]
MRVASSEVMLSILKEARLAGINHIETSPAYGLTQKFLGEALQKLNSQPARYQQKWVITSKVLPGISFIKGQKQLRDTLKDLRLESIDNLAVHGLNLWEHLHWAIYGDGFKLIQWALRKNLVKQWGFTSHGSQELIQEAIKTGQFNFCSLHLHLLDQERIPLAQLALNSGMGVMAISPADKGGHLHSPSKTLIKDCAPIHPLKLAYRYLLSNGISTLTLGASGPEDLTLAKELSSSDGKLTQEEESAIKNLQTEGRRRLGKTFCGQCRECLPCPKEVPITEILRLRNLSIGHDLQSFAKERYNLIGKAGHWWERYNASACERCGECLPRCPNNLKIPDLLEETHKKLLDKPLRRLWG